MNGRTLGTGCDDAESALKGNSPGVNDVIHRLYLANRVIAGGLFLRVRKWTEESEPHET